MVLARHERLAARLVHGMRNLGGVSPNDDRPATGLDAPRQTCTIMGSPPMAARGLSGSLVALSRAGITMRQGIMILSQLARDPDPGEAGARSNVSVATSG